MPTAAELDPVDVRRSVTALLGRDPGEVRWETETSSTTSRTPRMHVLLRCLEQPGTRLVELEGVWASPAFGAAGRREWIEARESATPLDDRRALRPDHRPARSPFAAAAAAAAAAG
ncbi:MAG: hypothetical protein ABIM89_18590 [Mycobacteriales bacterium]